MGADWFEDIAGTEHKAEIVKRHLARMQTADSPEHPLVAERKAKQAAARLAEHDRLFGVHWGVTLGIEPPDRIERPRFEAGDDGADGD